MASEVIPLLSESKPHPFECVVIDDDPDIGELISRVLSKIGVTSVHLADAGALAGALTERHPSIVFLDIALGRSDAIDGIRILRQQGFEGAVQLISGRNPELLDDIKAIGERHGLNMLAPIQKPFRTELLKQLFDVGASQPGGARRTDEPSDGNGHDPQFDLDEALTKRWIDLHYQPKLDLGSGRIVGAEGLARLSHPVHGLLGPTTFLPGASDAALMRLTELVVTRAFRDWETMHAAGFAARLAVNAPVKALVSPDLAPLVRDCRPKSDAWPGLLLEITEDEAVRELDAVTEAAVQLRIYEVELAIDDFGSGYSSFARLKQLPFSELKLDRSYVGGCADDQRNAGICQTVIDLARTHGAVSVAEGIETEADRDALVQLGCDLGQGFLFGRAMSVDTLVALAKRRHG